MMRKFLFILGAILITTSISQFINQYNNITYTFIMALKHKNFIIFFLFFVYIAILSIIPFICGAAILNLDISNITLKYLIYKDALIFGLINFVFIFISFCSTFLPNNTYVSFQGFSNQISISYGILVSNLVNGYIFGIAMRYVIKKQNFLYWFILLIIFLIWIQYLAERISSIDLNFSFTIIEIIIAEIGLFLNWLTGFFIQKRKEKISIFAHLMKTLEKIRRYTP